MKVVKGLLDGLVGVDLVKIFDKDGDGKVSFEEIRSASIDQWVKFIISLATSILAAMHFI